MGKHFIIEVDGVEVRVNGDPKMLEDPNTREALEGLARAAMKKMRAEDAGNGVDGVSAAGDEE